MESVNNGETSLSDFVSHKESERKDEDWSSLPVLLLWMIKDKLDIFDNTRFAAVCRDWSLASNSYPKVLQSVGDGLPWITSAFPMRSSLEFLSVTRRPNFEVHMPEYISKILFSKRGWILTQKNEDESENLFDSLFLVNPFTRAVIKLPPRPRSPKFYSGCFTTDSEGYPQRVFLVMLDGGESMTIIKTASPGHEEWTVHTFPGYGTRFSYSYGFIPIGDYVYFLDMDFRIMAFNVPDRTWKELRPPTNNEYQPGFIVEHEGELLFVTHEYDFEVEFPYYEFGSFTFYIYNIVASSWKRVSDGDVTDTTLFYNCGNSIATKGTGLKIYFLSHVRGTLPTYYDIDLSIRVEFYDLTTGNREILPVSLKDNNQTGCWVDIG